MASVKRRIFHHEIGARLAKLRDRKGLTQGQVELLSKGGVKKNTLKSIEAGRIENPNPETLRTLARVYGVPFAEIALPFIEANYGLDLIGHADERRSPLLNERGSDVPASDVETRRLESQYRELVTATAAIASQLFDLAAVHGADAQGKAARTTQSGARRRARKAG